MNIREHNRIAWDKNVEWEENRWTIPVSSEVVADCKNPQALEQEQDSCSDQQNSTNNTFKPSHFETSILIHRSSYIG